MPSRLRRYDEPGDVHFLTISCFRRLDFFRDDSVKTAFVDGLISTRVKIGIRWLGYIIMPEHVHLLLYPAPRGSKDPIPISRVLQYLKQDVGRRGKEALRVVWRQHQTLGTKRLDAWARGVGSKPFWKTRGHDVNVRSQKNLMEKLDYMHRNPVARGLVDHPEQWKWSSYRFFELGDASPIAMDWDGGWPIE